MERVFVESGKEYVGTMPHSEVCMHMRVAGTKMRFELVRPQSVQLRVLSTGAAFSSTILPGEAGLYWDNERRQWYGYGLEEVK